MYSNSFMVEDDEYCVMRKRKEKGNEERSRYDKAHKPKRLHRKRSSRLLDAQIQGSKNGDRGTYSWEEYEDIP